MLWLSLVLLIAAFSAGVAQDPKKQLAPKLTSEEGLAAKAKYDQAMLKVQKQAEEARAAAKAAYLADLKTALDALTKAGKLEEAVQIRDAIKQFEKADPSDADSEPGSKDKRLPKAIVGAIFRVNMVDLRFNETEFWFSDWKNKKGTWHMTSSNAAEGTDPQGKKWQFVFTPDFQRVFYVDGNSNGGAPRTR
jgi:hypothetical protein